MPRAPDRRIPYSTPVGSASTSSRAHQLLKACLETHLAIHRIVDAANLKPTDAVLEVGPGTGNLTVHILEKAKQVIAIEHDPRMAAEVIKRVQGRPDQRKLEVVVGDFVKADLPYFDERLYPPPQVDSTVVRIQPLDPPPPVKFEEFDGLLRLIFSRPNRTIPANFQAKGVMKMLEKNRLTWLAGQDQMRESDENMVDLVEKVLADARGDKRAAKMDINDILRLLSAFHGAGIHSA